MSIRKKVFKQVQKDFKHYNKKVKRDEYIIEVSKKFNAEEKYVSRIIIFLKDIGVLEEVWKIGEPFLKRGKQFNVIENYYKGSKGE